MGPRGRGSARGLILCSEKDEALARYALDGLSNNVMAAEYRITLPDEELLAAELDRTRRSKELRGPATLEPPSASAALPVRNPGAAGGPTEEPAP